MLPPDRALALSLALAACSGEAKPDETEPTPYIYDEADEPGIDVDLDVLSNSVQAMLQDLYRLNASPVFDAYDQVDAWRTESCPREYSMDGNVYWFDQCTTASGAAFSGYGFVYRYEDYPMGDGWTGDLDILQGAAQVVTPDGDILDVAGGAQLTVAVHDSQPANLYTSVLRGTFDWDGPGAEGTWLEAGATPDLSIQVYERTDVGGRMVQLSGGVADLDTDLTAVLFDQVQLIENALGGSCEQEPSGVVSVRTAEGDWIDLVFDGPVEFGDPAPDCDGKGRAWYRGQELGEVDVDFSVLFAQGGAPW